MARKVFFSFHFDRDNWRVGQVRNSGIVYDAPQFLDKAEWEKVKRAGDVAIQRWIDHNLHGTSVTCVLIGAETWTRPWVLYEIQQSFLKGNGLLGIRIHNLKDRHGQTDYLGLDPFHEATIPTEDGIISVADAATMLKRPVAYYDWKYDDGAARDYFGVQNFSKWVEAAAAMVGR